METPAMLSPTLNAQRRMSVQRKSLIHQYYILLKAHYFLFFSAFGMLYPVLNITLRGRGLTDWEISLANVIVPFLVFFTNPLLGFVADRTGRYLTTFSCIFALATIIYSVMFFLPSIKTNDVQGFLIKDIHSRRVLDFCAQPDVITACKSRSTCGCTYEARCASLEGHNRFAFNFSMNAQLLNRETSNECGNDYRVSVEKAVKNLNLGENLRKKLKKLKSKKKNFCIVH